MCYVKIVHGTKLWQWHIGGIGGHQPPLKPKFIISYMKGLGVVDPISFWTTIEVKCYLIDQYVKKQSGRGMSTFNGSNVVGELKKKSTLKQTIYRLSI